MISVWKKVHARGSEFFPLRVVPYGMENHFYHIRWAPMSVTIFIMHVHKLRNAGYANAQQMDKKRITILR